MIPKGDSKSVTEEQPATPEMASPSTGSASAMTGRNNLLPPTAPKGKPRAPPLIIGKAKMSEAGAESLSNEGKIPILKTKCQEREQNHDGKRHKSANNSARSTLSSGRETAGPKTASDAHRTVERVRIGRGIEMQRISQESQGVKAKNPSSSKTNGSSPNKESSHVQMVNGAPQKRRMTRTETSVQEVKSFNGHLLRPTGSGSSINSKGKSKVTQSVEDKLNVGSKLESDEAWKNEVTTEPQAVKTEDQEAEFKSLEDFLRMPVTALPDTKSSSSVKKSSHKSKETLSSKSRCSSKDQKKPYNADEVKSFMLKQKEIRRIQHMKESKQKEAEAAKRQRMLKDLDSRCQKMAVRGKVKTFPEPSNVDEPSESSTSDFNPKSPQLAHQSPSMKYLKPLLDRKKNCFLRKSSSASTDVAKQSQYLLTEFENIVKRECISFLQKLPVSTSEAHTNVHSEKVKVDKAVSTSTSLLDISVNAEQNSIKPIVNEINDTWISNEEGVKSNRIPSPKTVERAASKIQAAYKGYKIRQALRDAGFQFGYKKPTLPSQSCSSILQNSGNKYIIPKMPEKPYDNFSKIMPMSPVTIRRKSSSSLLNCYIPPATSSGSQTPGSSSRARVLPAFPITPARTFDEPYPLLSKPSEDVNILLDTKTNPSRRHTFGFSTSTPNDDPPGVQRVESSVVNQSSLPTYQVISTNCNFDFAVPSAIPSILDVLREKIRLSEANEGTEKKHMTQTKDPKQHRLELDGFKQDGEMFSRSLDTRSSAEQSTTPKLSKHHHRRRPHTRSHRLTSPDSSTTVDTDAEYAPSGSKSSTSNYIKTQKSSNVSSSGSKSEEVLPSSHVDDLTSTSTFDKYLAPALQLRYEAEKEHLKIIEKALQVKLQPQLNLAASAESLPNAEQSKHGDATERSNKGTPETDRVQLAIANCHKESMKAAAEMAKWLSEFQKTSRDQERSQAQQTPINLAATVIAAVEQARAMGIEKRREKRLQARKHGELPPSGFSRPLPRSPSESESSESRLKSDKAVETSIALLRNFEKAILGNDAPSQLTNLMSTGKSKDYQQQFPSESDRDSPAGVNPFAAFKISDKVRESNIRLTRGSSFDEDTSKTNDILEYGSIIPSGNTIEIASLDAKVSTLDSLSQLSSTEKQDFHPISTSMLDEVNANDLPHYFRDEPVSKQEEHSAYSNVVQEQSNIVTEQSQVGESLSVQSSINIEEESFVVDVATQSVVEEMVTSDVSSEGLQEQSKIDDLVDSSVEHSARESVQSPRLDSSQAPLESVAEKSLDTEEPADVETDIPQSHYEDSVAVQTDDWQGSDHFEPEDVSENDISVQDKATETEMPESIETDKEVSIEENSRIKEKKLDADSVQVSAREDFVEVLSNVEDEISTSHNKSLSVQIPEVNQSIGEEVKSSMVSTEKNGSISLRQFTGMDEQEFSETPAANHSIHKTVSLSNEEKSVHEMDQSGEAGESFKKTSSICPKLVSETYAEDDFENSSKLKTSTENKKLEGSGTEEVDESLKTEGKVSIVEDRTIEDPAVSHIVDEDNNDLGQDDNLKEENATQEHLKPLDDVLSIEEIKEVETTALEVDINSNDEEVKSVLIQTEIDESLQSEESESKVQQFETRIETTKDGDVQALSGPTELKSCEQPEEDEVITETSVSVNISCETEKSEEESAATPVHVTNDTEVATLFAQPDYEIADEASSTPTDTSVFAEKEVVASNTEMEVAYKTNDASIKSDFEMHFKPPPPYSPPSSLDSTSLSSRSLIISVPGDKLVSIAEQQGDIVWTAWSQSCGNRFPDIQSVMEELSTKQIIKSTQCINDSNGNIQTTAEHNFDILLCHLIYETMKEVLQVKNEYSTFIERVRPGPLALEAQKLKIPKTKEALVSLVLKRTNAVVPSTFLSCSHSFDIEKPRARKWCSRPREIVDEILLEELIDEDYQWTEWWPEEVIISNHISTKIVQTMIHNALLKRKYALSK